MRRLIGRRGKGRRHGRIAGGWIDLARVAEGERPRASARSPPGSPASCAKNPEKLAPVALGPAEPAAPKA